MGATVGREADALAFFEALAREPYRFDFYQTLRRIECIHADKPRWGTAVRPIDEPLRLGQDPELSFAPAPLAAFEGGRVPRLQVRLFGLLGPNGPLPLHITEYVRERVRHAGDRTLARFIDVLQHRLMAMFYRAWAQAQPHVNRDRPADDRFAVYVGSLFGVSTPALRDRDTVPDLAKFFHAGWLIAQTRHADGLEAILRSYFQVPVRVREFVGHWLELARSERTALSPGRAALGMGAVLGQRVWDRQHKCRIELGPLTYDQYCAFLPPAPVHRGETDAQPSPQSADTVIKAAPPPRPRAPLMLARLVDWVRLYLGFELAWDVRLLLQRTQVPALALGAGARLGWTTWLGARGPDTDADNLCLDAESLVRAVGARAL